MNSRLDWLVLSDYYSIYVTNAPLTLLTLRQKNPTFQSGFLPSKERSARNQNMIARGCAAELSVARSTNASKLARSS